MKQAYILIGPSGAGKSTTTQQLIEEHRNFVSVFSLDACRLSFFAAEKFTNTREENADIYAAAFDFANSNGKVFDDYVTCCWKEALKSDAVIVDNTNLSKKSRARWVQDLKHNEFKIVMIEFLVPLKTIIDRQATRPDKSIPIEIVKQQYFRQEAALVGSECDEVRIKVSA